MILWDINTLLSIGESTFQLTLRMREAKRNRQLASSLMFVAKQQSQRVHDARELTSRTRPDRRTLGNVCSSKVTTLNVGVLAMSLHLYWLLSDINIFSATIIRVIRVFYPSGWVYIPHKQGEKYLLVKSTKCMLQNVPKVQKYFTKQCILNSIEFDNMNIQVSHKWGWGSLKLK